MCYVDGRLSQPISTADRRPTPRPDQAVESRLRLLLTNVRAVFIRVGQPTLPWAGPMWVSSMMKPLSNFCTLGRVCLMGTLWLPGSPASTAGAATPHMSQESSGNNHELVYA